MEVHNAGALRAIPRLAAGKLERVMSQAVYHLWYKTAPVVSQVPRCTASRCHGRCLIHPAMHAALPPLQERYWRIIAPCASIASGRRHEQSLVMIDMEGAPRGAVARLAWLAA